MLSNGLKFGIEHENRHYFNTQRVARCTAGQLTRDIYFLVIE